MSDLRSLAHLSTLLLGVPTNAQLTLTLLRLGEAEKTQCVFLLHLPYKVKQ